MAPTSKSSKSSTEVPTTTKSPHHHHSKSQESKNPIESPSSKSHGSSSRNSGGAKGKESSRSHHHHHRRRRSSLKSSLQETLSSFGDDVIKVKNWPAGLTGYDNHGYFQPDVSFNIPASQESIGKQDDHGPGTSSTNSAAPYGDVSATPLENGGVENELALIMSHHDPNFQTKHFEKIHPNEVGVRASKWQKLLQASVSSNKFQKLRKQDKSRKNRSETEHCLEQFYDSNGKISFDPPFWGVSRPTRTKISFLSLSLILHELACFTSCVLVGCMIFQGMEAISWVQQKPFTDNWLFFKWYSSFQTILVVITCLGFLNRVDTTEQRSLWLLPLFLVPVLCLSVSDYCNKAWELQRLECHNFYHLDPASKMKVHLTQDCSSVFSMLDMLNTTSFKSTKVATSITQERTPPSPTVKFATELEARGAASFIIRILAAISTLVISTYLFCCRKNHYLVDTFGPPKEFVGNVDLVIDFARNENFSWDSHKIAEGKEGDEDEEDDGMNVIYERAAKMRNK